MTIAKGGNGKKKEKTLEPEQTVDYVEKNPDGVVSSKFYGIKSYLHNFYDKGSKTGSPIDEELYLLSDPPKRRVVYTCRAALVIGMGLLLVGAIGIIVAHMWPAAPISVGGEPAYAQPFVSPGIDNITVWKMVGLVVFAFGGMIIAISLLIPLCCRIKWERETAYDQIGEPIRVYPAATTEQAGVPGYGAAGSPTKAIPTPGGAQPEMPITEELKHVQPGQDEKFRVSADDSLLK